jgi:hypothetical protein
VRREGAGYLRENGARCWGFSYGLAACVAVSAESGVDLNGRKGARRRAELKSGIWFEFEFSEGN